MKIATRSRSLIAVAAASTALVIGVTVAAPAAAIWYRVSGPYSSYAQCMQIRARYVQDGVPLGPGGCRNNYWIDGWAFLYQIS